VYAEKGKNSIAGANGNMGDQAIIKNTCGHPVAQMCETYDGCSKPWDSKKLGSGFNTRCCVDGGGNTDTCDGKGPSPSAGAPSGYTGNNRENPNNSTLAVPLPETTPKDTKNPTDGSTPTIGDSKGDDVQNTPSTAIPTTETRAVTKIVEILLRTAILITTTKVIATMVLAIPEEVEIKTRAAQDVLRIQRRKRRRHQRRIKRSKPDRLGTNLHNIHLTLKACQQGITLQKCTKIDG
jgi:hypothetical protein